MKISVFQKARLKLTGWYLLIIMLVSTLFSISIYSSINQELERFAHMQQIRQQRFERIDPFSFEPREPQFDPQIIIDARNRVILTLALINLGILGISGAAGYFLAGRTLRPIREAMDEQNRFISDASHELRTPLTALRTETEVSLRNKNMSKDEAKQILKSNLEEVIRLQNLSDNLLLLAQSEMPTTQRNFEEFDITHCVETSLKKLDPIIKKKNITIKKHIKPTRVVGIEDRICEAVTIFLDNAVKYTGKNGEVAITIRKNKDDVEIIIRDTGVGISETDLPHIFDRFYRASKSRGSQETSGYGLGLSIAKKIIEQHHGSIDVESQENIGTTFTIQLPRK